VNRPWRRRSWATVLLAVCAGAGAARPCRAAGNGCPSTWEAAAGPLPGGTGPADFGAIPNPCRADELLFRLRTALLIAPSMPDYYGSLVEGALLRFQWALSPESWLSLAADAITYRYVNSGGLVGSSWSAGPPTVAYYRTVASTTATQAAAYVRVLLPLDSARSAGFEAGLELGASVRTRLGRRFALDGGLALTAPVDLVAGETHGQLEPMGLVETWYSPRPAAALALGVYVQAQLAPDAALLTLAPRMTGRVALRQGLWLALLVEVPVLGRDRTDLVGSLFLGYGS
jgi:hypothetical protein